MKSSDDESPAFGMLAFKIMNDPFVGSLTFCPSFTPVCWSCWFLVVLNTVKGTSVSALAVCYLMHANEP